MPEMSTLSGKSKVPMLPSQGVSYAKWGRWVDAFSSCLTLKGLHLFAALDSTMPFEFPEVEGAEEAKDVKPSTEQLNVLTLQYKVANKYEFAAKSAEAYALLYEAVQIQRAMKKHKGNFPIAFAGVSHYVTGNLKTIGVKGKAIARFQSINLAGVVIVHFAFEHVDELDPIVLERRKGIRFCGQLDQVRLNDHPTGIRAHVPQQIVLVTRARARSVNVHTAACLDQYSRTLLFEAAKERCE